MSKLIKITKLINYNLNSKKKRVGIIFGGKSAEHEISLLSARNVIEAIDKSKYEVVLIGIDKTGKWYLNEDSKFLLNESDPSKIKLEHSEEELALIPGDYGKQMISLNSNKSIGNIDVAFPILHGTFGEDGTVQGLLKLSDIPFVGADVLGSAVGMDKDVMKRLLRDSGVKIPNFLVFNKFSYGKTTPEEIIKKLGLPLFLKPANMGSSVGISKAHNKEEFIKAVEEAFKFDSKIIIEENINGREIECSVLGNEEPIASLPGEVHPTHEFYDYEAKYMDENGATFEIPAKLDNEIVEKIRYAACESFKVLCCEGMARVDFFLTDDNEIYVNEINTIPGFTKISMYPKMWEATGIPYNELISRLIELAIERFERDKKIKTSFF
ncbi:MAG TPA: D-alanine--D-alanine ligase [Ignavibacteria bacterium]|nr:D-alanine--D-alanine ligase [Ignavibacteria bacterium]